MGRTKFSTYAYVLFLIIVIGTFASIAQNDYGVQLIAGGCFGFSLIILWRLYSMLTTENPILPRSMLTLEYLAMSIIMGLFGLRALRIRFTAVEIFFVIMVVVMALLYFFYLLRIHRIYSASKQIKFSILFLYISIILFFTSLSFTFINENLSTLLGASSFLSAVLFIVWYFYSGKEIIYEEDRVNLIDKIFQYLNLSPVILSIIMLISLYMGLFKINILPPIYTGEVPIRYLEMTENPVSTNKLDKAKSEIYWGAYQEFLKFMNERKDK